MDTLSGRPHEAGTPARPPGRLLRDDGIIAERLPTLAGWLSRIAERYVPELGDRPGWVDVWAVLLLASTTIYLVGRDGGRPRDATMFAETLLEQLAGIAPVLVLAVPFLLTSISDVARDRILLRWLLLGWSVGPMIALAAAGNRDGWVRSFAALAVAVPVFLAARRVWRARWGPPVLCVIVVAAAIRAWGTGLLLWMSSVSGWYWPLLSWHNQTATVMGLFFLVGIAIAWTGRRWLRGVGVLVAVLGGSSLWLAASRGAFLLTLVALAVALAVVLGSPSSRAAWPLTALVVALIVPIVLVVAEARVEMPGDVAAEDGSALSEVPGSERALLDRGTDVSNLTMRFDYWNGAVSMFLSSPLVGTGPGSFPHAAPPHLRPDYFPTLSTHNEYLEVLGTMGLVGAVPVWGATLGAVWLVLLGLRRPAVASQARGTAVLSPGRWAGRIASIGGLTLLGLHAGFDLDWLWPLLLGAAAIAAGVLHADLVPTGTTRSRGLATTVVAAAVILALGTASGVVLQRLSAAPWDLPLATSQVLRSVDAGDVAGAQASLETLERWNPGSHDAVMAAALVAYGNGQTPAREVVTSIHPRGIRFPVQTQVASLLLDDGEVDAAHQVLTNLRPHLDARARGAQPGRSSAYRLELDVAEHRGGCDVVRAVWESELRERVERSGLDPENVARAWNQGREANCLEPVTN